MKKILKICGWICIGYLLAIISHYPYESEIGSELSPNKKYRLIYEATRFGGIFPLGYRHYITVRDAITDKYIFSHFIDSDDIKSRDNNSRWEGDTIVVEVSHPDDDEPYKIETIKGKMTFYLPEGFATK